MARIAILLMRRSERTSQMAQLTDAQRELLSKVVGAVLDAVKAGMPTGAPGGVIYAGLMEQGCSFNQYTSLMAGLVRCGKLRQDGDLYFIVGE
jgi:hypothetical protein